MTTRRRYVYTHGLSAATQSLFNAHLFILRRGKVVRGLQVETKVIIGHLRDRIVVFARWFKASNHTSRRSRRARQRTNPSPLRASTTTIRLDCCCGGVVAAYPTKDDYPRSAGTQKFGALFLTSAMTCRWRSTLGRCIPRVSQILSLCP